MHRRRPYSTWTTASMEEKASVRGAKFDGRWAWVVRGMEEENGGRTVRRLPCVEATVARRSADRAVVTCA